MVNGRVTMMTIYFVEIPHQSPPRCWTAVSEQEAIRMLTLESRGESFEGACAQNAQYIHAQVVFGSTNEAAQAAIDQVPFPEHQKLAAVRALRGEVKRFVTEIRNPALRAALSGEVFDPTAPIMGVRVPIELAEEWIFASDRIDGIEPRGNWFVREEREPGKEGGLVIDEGGGDWNGAALSRVRRELLEGARDGIASSGLFKAELHDAAGSRWTLSVGAVEIFVEILRCKDPESAGFEGAVEVLLPLWGPDSTDGPEIPPGPS